LIRVALAAPGLALRLGLHELLSGLPGVQIAAEAASPRHLPPVDVLVLAADGLLNELGEEPPPVLLLSNDSGQAARLAALPVWGLLPLEASPEELSAALHALAEGLLAGSPGLMAGLFERRPLAVMAGAEQVLDPLTGRERQVLQLAAEGLANKEIAAALKISEHTVKFHLSSLYAKLGVASRTEAVRAGARGGWVVL